MTVVVAGVCCLGSPIRAESLIEDAKQAPAPVTGGTVANHIPLRFSADALQSLITSSGAETTTAPGTDANGTGAAWQPRDPEEPATLSLPETAIRAEDAVGLGNLGFRTPELNLAGSGQ
jgi:hypothetical protein